jgi:cysteinyl-tRNA synthetase
MTAATPAPELRLAGRPVPIVGRARVYVCGITPYDTTHLGHAATFVWTDVAVRILRHLGAVVDVCRNITDVDDDLLAQARRKGVGWRALAAQQTYRFEDDMRLLGIAHPTFEPASHNYVDEVIALALALVREGVAYEQDGGVWFRGDDVPARAGISARAAIDVIARHHLHSPTVEGRPLDVPV